MSDDLTNWIEGEPKEDGLYACEPDGGSTMYVIRIKCGKKMWTDGDKNTSYLCPIIRYYRLPEPVKPLQPPRRFRAKLNGKPVVGVETECNRLVVTSCSFGFQLYVAEQLTDLEWLDKETP